MRMVNPNFMNGVPEFLVLRLLTRQEMYGYELVQAIRLQTQGAITLSEGVVYPVLHALEKQGALKSRNKAVNGRTRVYYAVTNKGTKHLAGLAAQWDRIAAALQMSSQESVHVPSATGSFAGKIAARRHRPRHVRRYLRELHQHFDDLLRAETENGLSGKAAIDAARTRLGSDDELAVAMLAQPELRSYTARYPWATLGIAPVIAVLAILYTAVAFQVSIIELHWRLTNGDMAAAYVIPEWLKSFFVAWDWIIPNIIPFTVAGGFCVLAARQRMKLGWMMCATFLAALPAIFLMDVSTKWSPIPGKSEFTVGAGFSTDETPIRLAINIAIIGVMLAVHWYWRHRCFCCPENADEHLLGVGQHPQAHQKRCQRPHQHGDPAGPCCVLFGDKCNRHHDMSDNENGQPGRRVIGADMAQIFAADRTAFDLFEIRRHQAPFAAIGAVAAQCAPHDLA
jgi:PadR family transcriptional regulator PadR